MIEAGWYVLFNWGIIGSSNGLLGAKQLPEPTMVYCKMDPWEQNSVKF